MIDKKALKIINEAMAIEAQEAKEAGQLGFMARAMVQATLPHKDPKTNEFSRTNGNYTLTLLAPSTVGLPFGSLPRLLLCWMTTEVTRTKERTLVLGDSLTDFMRQLDMTPTGGRHGSITRLRQQMTRLFSSSVSCTYSDEERDSGAGFRIVKGYDLWWKPQSPGQAGLWKSTVTLSEDFFEEIIKSPVPLDMRALKALKQSPMALDIYIWLTHRMSYLKKPTPIPWEALQAQFGAEYNRANNFRAAFKRALANVLTVYPDAKVKADPKGLFLSPSKTHIKKIK